MRTWQHDDMKPVRWIFLGGGALFLVAALVLRELPYEGAKITALTFTIIGFCWIGPQLVIMLAGQWSAARRAQK